MLTLVLTPQEVMLAPAGALPGSLTLQVLSSASNGETVRPRCLALQEVILAVSEGSMPPKRPQLRAVANDALQPLVDLMEDCWAEVGRSSLCRDTCVCQSSK